METSPPASQETSLTLTLALDTPRFVAADKPPGWLSVPSRLGADDPRPCVGRVLEAQLGVRLWPVHRLDEEATGVLLFAKDAEAHRIVSGWFENRIVGKRYEAWTEKKEEAEPAKPGQDFLWRSTLARGKKRAYEAPHGKRAETRARLVANVADVAKGGDAPESQHLAWALDPVTGRSHQLRYELSHRGYPILGDKLYGATKDFPAGGIALRCVCVDFVAAPGADALGLPAQVVVPSLEAILDGKRSAAP
jgi:tRNA pseudouridine32 synthase/23S rRNA pseudouridine746 synthase